ncbi:MAG: hypothetical protein GEU79_07060 [Acidimicrobiia bacterium]|nr:hypothetical protein [Acidimicrobiia bacterium]
MTPTVIRGAQKDLSDYRMDALSSTQVPWFVELRVKNVGKGVLQGPSFTERLVARNGRGDSLDNVVLPNLDRCRHTDRPRRFNKDYDPVIQCRVFFVPRGQRLASIGLHNIKGNQIDWKVPQRIAGKAKAPTVPNAGPAGKWMIQGKAKTVNWRHGSIGLRASIRPVSVVKGKKADISDYRLDAAHKLTTPWYITLSSKHVGERRAAGVPDFEHWTVAYNEKNQRIRGVVIQGPFPKCKDAPRPKGFGPKSKALKSCAVFLVPDGQRINRIGMVHNDDSGEVNWKVTRP